MDFQFYPTSAKTAALMWAKFKRKIGVVCDPSAGQGHLLKHAENGFEGVEEADLPWIDEIPDETFSQGRYRLRIRERARFKFQFTSRKFLAVEIDPRHHANLREMGGTVLGYDFLSIESLATVDQVIMNPPFADGARHVLHAWKCVYDAEIVAIVNAETIRNPHSQERQALVALIEKHGSVEFHQNQFLGSEVERQTAVEVALIHLDKVPETSFGLDSILAGMRRGDNQRGADLEPEVCTALALPENLVSNTYQRFVIAVAAARRAAEAQAVADKASGDLGISLEEMQAKGVGNEFREAGEPLRVVSNRLFQDAYESLKRQAWAQIIRSAILNDKLSNQARRKVEAEAEVIYGLEFSVANVHGFLAGLYASLGDIYSEMVCGLFDTIIGRSSDNVAFYKSWKSNDRHRFGMRIRRTRFIVPRFNTTGRGDLMYESRQLLAEIDKVFGYLHGLSGPYDGLEKAWSRSEPLGGERISSRFFDFRFYKGVGTIHFYPKSQEIVEKLNRFVGSRRQWLPDVMESANADFVRQYDTAERLTKEYQAKWNESRENRYGSSPSYAALRETSSEESRSVCVRFERCIGLIHDQHGLQCGPLLKSNADATESHAESSTGSEHLQMLLLTE